MKIHVSSIESESRRQTVALPVETLPLVLAVTASDGIAFTAPVTVAFSLTREGPDAVRVDAAVDTRVETVCGRCLEKASAAVHVDLAVVFERAAAGGNDPEAADADVERAFYDGEVIDLAQILQEEVIAALPLRPLCRDDCQGLCPGCGANLNDGPCDCGRTRVDPRLAALKRWRPR